MTERTIKPIAYIKTDFNDKFGLPRQSGRVPNLTGEIIFYKEYQDPSCLKELEGFSHIWVLFDFSLSHKKEFSPTVRPPRLGGNKRVGVFASRSPFRPNSIGLSSLKLLGIEKTLNNGYILKVSGVDILSGTDIYDIKPYIPSCDCHVDAIGGYADDFTDYKLNVIFPDNLKGKIPTEKLSQLIDILKEDPRPSYQNDDRIYKMDFANINISFSVKNDVLTVVDVK